MTTSTLSRPAESSSDGRQSERQQRRGSRTNKIRRVQEKSAVMVHRHALPSVAVSLGVGLVAGLVVGGLLAQAIQARREPQSLFDRSRRRMGDTLSNLSEMVPTSYREWRR